MNSFKLVLIVIAFLLVLASYFLIAVSGIGIIFTYFSLPFLYVSRSIIDKKYVKLYWVLFLIAHIVLAWRAWDDMRSESDDNVRVIFNPIMFEKCSNDMFGGVGKFQQSLSLEQKKMFSACMSRER